MFFDFLRAWQMAASVTAMLTDFYQITIALGYFHQGRQDEPACFDLFYRTQPFKGSFAIFAGLAEAIEFVSTFKFSDADLAYIAQNLPGAPPTFIEYLKNIDMKKVKITAFREGAVVFPREPLLRVEGPIAYCQLLETPLLNAINFPTLMTTNALRFRLHAKDAVLMEFGLRRAQGPHGAMAASRYSFIGGFNGTSNVLAGQKYGIPISGTVAHSFIMSFSSLSQLKTRTIPHAQTGALIDLWEIAKRVLQEGGVHSTESELISFVAQAQTFPGNFLALVDSYDTLKSGIPNFLAVCYALDKAGYRGKGVRLDSGDLAELSKAVRKMYIDFANKYKIEYIKNLIICASNDINEEELIRLARENHECNSFGIGTHLVTCQKQPALGGVYKLVEISGVPRVKVSNSLDKSSLPAKKLAFRLYDASGKEAADLLTEESEGIPAPGRIPGVVVYPTSGAEVVIDAARVEPLLVPAWDGGVAHVDDITTVRQRVLQARTSFNRDVLTVDRQKLYTVLVSKQLFRTLSALTKELMPA
jgi:nicotinate phosphoribosyltransferase